VSRGAAGLLAALALAGCPGDDAAAPTATVTVFAAASTADALGEAARAFEAERPDVAVRTSFASSATLARQIEEGAPADVYVSANARWVDHLAGRGRLEPGTRVDLLANDLVLVAGPGNAAGPLDPGGDPPAAGRIAIGDPDHVPAGIYGARALRALGWWDAIGERLVPTADVRAALALVARGECPWGVVYASDAAAAADDVRVALTFPEDATGPIRYPAAIVAGRRSPAAEAFLAHLTRSGDLFSRHGFRPLAPAGG